MQQIELEVSLRSEKGKGAARRIRREGKIPAVLYGRRMETFHLTLRPEDLRKILTRGARENTLIGLKVDGPGAEKISNQVVMLKDVQVHPLTQSYLHADFYAVSMDVKIEVEVPVHLTGKAEGTKVGGILAQSLRELKIRCLPSDIPDSISVDVSPLKIGDSLHVRDIPPSDKYEILTDANFTLVSVTPPISEAKYEEIVAAPEAEREIVEPERIGVKKEEAEEPKEAKGAKEVREAKGAKE